MISKDKAMNNVSTIECVKHLLAKGPMEKVTLTFMDEMGPGSVTITKELIKEHPIYVKMLVKTIMTPEKDWTNEDETAYIMSMPGMKEAFEQPLETCTKESDIKWLDTI